MTDVIVHGNPGDTVFLVEPLTQAASEWIVENVEGETTWLAGNLAVEHRYIDALIDGMREAGLVVELS
jgi:hypothetical protein